MMRCALAGNAHRNTAGDTSRGGGHGRLGDSHQRLVFSPLPCADKQHCTARLHQLTDEQKRAPSPGLAGVHGGPAAEPDAEGESEPESRGKVREWAQQLTRKLEEALATEGRSQRWRPAEKNEGDGGRARVAREMVTTEDLFPCYKRENLAGSGREEWVLDGE